MIRIAVIDRYVFYRNPEQIIIHDNACYAVLRGIKLRRKMIKIDDIDVRGNRTRKRKRNRITADPGLAGSSGSHTADNGYQHVTGRRARCYRCFDRPINI